MKKVLFATTALIATASVAAADVNLGGSARAGVVFNDTGVAGAATTTDINTRFRVNFDGETSTDSGLTFGGRVRLQATQSGNTNNGATLSGARVYVKFGGLEVGVGNNQGAVDNLNGYYQGTVGFTGFVDANITTVGIDGFSSGGAGRGGVDLAYSAGDFRAHASFSDSAGEQRSAVSAQYTFSGWTVGLGFQDSNNAANDITVATVTGTVGSVGLGALVTDEQGGQTFGISASFSVGVGTTITAAAASSSITGRDDLFAIGASHDLGGGASLSGGVASVGSATTADFGVTFSF